MLSNAGTIDAMKAFGMKDLEEKFKNIVNNTNPNKNRLFEDIKDIVGTDLYLRLEETAVNDHDFYLGFND